MFILFGKARSELKKILDSIPEEKRKEFLVKIEEIAMQALVAYAKSQIKQ
jgi:hypothetical protein